MHTTWGSDLVDTQIFHEPVGNDFSMLFHENSSISMRNQGSPTAVSRWFLGNLGVDQIRPRVVCEPTHGISKPRTGGVAASGTIGGVAGVIGGLGLAAAATVAIKSARAKKASGPLTLNKA